ncbi:helicase HerA-like domain-containing protein [Parvibaculum sp.]|uniref:helicase HerA-like domain-containing protein n=1 Tax=Parvibaculum sp. TaxID=2024848 RepID=UPI002B880F9C|nr:helicase HerA-like domain-containing protein [Parvibaculum sp.]HUD53457.1 helicase HerA-like domain-containing protein [Parvibaculum sp.]
MADGDILIGKSGETPEILLLKLANRHGLVTGATGTGKTVTLQVLAEGFSNAGVPVFAADIKGDLSGLSQPGDGKAAFVNRAKEIGVDYVPDRFPTIFWDVFGEQGHPVRATISEMGPLLIARLLDLNDTQEGVLNIAFRLADEQGLLLLDLKDLRAMLAFVSENAASLSAQYGNVSTQSVGAIQRQLLVLENQKGDQFFGEPALEITDLMRTDRDGRGIVNILAATKLMDNPRLYATFLLWLLSELFEELPEVGDLEKPKLVFFFDEAHLLFNDAPKALVESVERVVRLIRSKGVGVYFVTQNPLDVPDKVLAQLGNRVQHALRAFTPRDQKAVRAAAETFRQNPAFFKTEEAILALGVGEALVSTLDAKGAPSMVERTLIAPPGGRVGPATDAERQAIVAASPLRGRYDQAIDRESAYELLQKKAGQTAETSARPASTTSVPSSGPWGGTPSGRAEPEPRQTERRERAAPRPRREPVSRTERVMTNMATSAARSIGTQVGRAIFRSILGSMTKR